MELSSQQSAHNEFYDRPGDAIKKPQRSSKRPIAVTIASILLIAGALLQLEVAFSLMSLSEPYIPKADIFRAVAPFLILEVVLSSLLIVAAIGMLVMKPWARKLGIWLAIFGFILWTLSSQILGPIGFLVYSILLILLMKTSVRRAFYNRSPHPTEEHIYEVTPFNGWIGDTRDSGVIKYWAIMMTLICVGIILLMLALAYGSALFSPHAKYPHLSYRFYDVDSPDYIPDLIEGPMSPISHTAYFSLLGLCFFGTVALFGYGRNYVAKAQLVIDKQRITIRKRLGKKCTTVFEARLGDVDCVRAAYALGSLNAVFIELKNGQTIRFLVVNTFSAFMFLRAAFDDLGIGYETSRAKGAISVISGTALDVILEKLGMAHNFSTSGFVLKLK